MASMTEITCKCGCGKTKKVRTADVKRGWGLFYSKSCKARHQEKRTGQYKKYMNRRSKSDDLFSGTPFVPHSDEDWYDEEEFYANFSNEDDTDI